MARGPAHHRRSGSAQGSGRGAAGLSTRSKIVWTALVASMTGVGGLMAVLQGGPQARFDGLAVPPLVAAAGPSTIEAIYRTRAPIPEKRWQAIVIHHSESLVGTPATLEAKARQMNLDGLGYHFVIGNGSGMDDGEIHVGFRWLEQLPGAHVAGPQGDWYNRNAIGICLVGDGRRKAFSAEQLRRLVQLTSSLAERLGVPADRVYLHRDLARTDGPGAMFPEAAFREQIAHAR